MRTGPELNERRILADGTAVVLRHIRPADASELREAFDRLSEESRHRRFFGEVGALSASALKYLTEVDGVDHVAIVATCDSLDLKKERGLGVARFVRLTDDSTVAEAAVVVVDDAQRKGLGRLLTTTLAEAARERGVRTFRADVLADNGPMIAILDEVGARVIRGEDGVVTYDVSLDVLEEARSPGAVARLLRTAASSMAVLLRRLALPSGFEAADSGGADGAAGG